MQAVRRVWDAGHENFHVMLPFVRTAYELERCRALVAESGLLARRGFELWIMAEVPSVLFNLERYAKLGIAGISIGSNDLTQLMLGATATRRCWRARSTSAIRRSSTTSAS